MAITALPTPPSRQDPTNFNDRADTFLGALPLFQTEANALQTNVNTSEVNAVNSAAAVLAATNIVKWVSGTTYAEGAVVWSPINGLGYRRITASGSGTTDPSADTTNYKQVNGTGDVSTTGNQTIAGVKTFSSNIVGNLTGNVTGNLTGNATTATSATTATTATNATNATTAASCSGNSATVTTITTAQVLNATATAVEGAVGTYAFLRDVTNSDTNINQGATVAGSNLRFSSMSFVFSDTPPSTWNASSGQTPSGTWRLMGFGDRSNGLSTIRYASLFLRIS
jgi:hypothetical protein